MAYFRTKTVKNKGKTYRYLQLVESNRVEGRVVQTVLASLGRLEDLQADGGVDRLAMSLARYTEKVMVLDALQDGSVVADDCRQWGPALVFDRMWKKLGLGRIVRELAGKREFQFDVERVVFAMALQRLVRAQTGSDRDGCHWLQEVRIDGLTDGTADVEPALQHFYRAVGFLDDAKETIEERLWFEGRDLFNRQVDIALFDTTSLYFEGEGPKGLAARGKSKDGRYDCTQVVLGVVLTQDGWPLCFETWPGNTTDVTTVVPMLDKLRNRFDIRRVVFVADRGMTSKANLQAIEDAGFDYIVGCKLRGDKEVRDTVLSRAGTYRTVADNLRVKQVEVEGRRYVVCHNPIEEEHDRFKREAIVERLRENLVGKSPKKAMPHRGYKRFLSVTGATVRLDEAAIKKDARYDGKYVLRTSTDWATQDVAAAYRSLWQVEHFFRDFKTPLNARPIYHRNAKQVRGHLMGCFLGMVLATALRRALDELGEDAKGVEWHRLMRDLRRIQAIDMTLGDRRYLVRSELEGKAWLAFRAAGIKPPPRVTPLPPHV